MVYFPPELITSILNWSAAPIGSFLQVLSYDPLPPDCLCITTHANPDRRAIGVLMAHESFEPIPGCAEVPSHSSSGGVVQVLQREYASAEAAQAAEQVRALEDKYALMQYKLRTECLRLKTENEDLHRQVARLSDRETQLRQQIEDLTEQTKPVELEQVP